ncbi:MAG: hypothetical protein ACOYLS_03605 [Polymorphobacter sp.]
MSLQRLLYVWFALLALTAPVRAADIVPRPVFQNGHAAPPDTFAFSHDGKTLASLVQGADNLILWDIRTGHLVARYDFSPADNSVPGPDGPRKAVTGLYRAIEFSADDKFVTVTALVVITSENNRVLSRDLFIDLASGIPRWSDDTRPTDLTVDHIDRDVSAKIQSARAMAVIRNPNGKGCVAVVTKPMLYPDCTVLQEPGPNGIAMEGDSYPLTQDFKLWPFDVAVSPPGLRIAIQRQSGNYNAKTGISSLTVGVFDVRSGRLRELPDLLSHEAGLTWTSNNLLAVLPKRWDYPSAIGEQSEDKGIVLPPLLLIDPDTLHIVSKILSRCRNMLAGDALIGFGGPDCSQPAAGTMWRNALDGRGWVPMAFRLPDDEVLVDMTMLRGGTTLLITSTRADSNLSGSWVGRTDIRRVVDARTGAIVPRNDAMFDANGNVRDAWRPAPPPSPPRLGRIIAAGALPQLGAGWGQTPDYTLHFWRSTDFAPLLDFYLMRDNGYLVTSPYGTYDTNLGPDTPLFRWAMADDPRRSLAPQTFMRDYFEPGLMVRRLLCTVPDNCAAVFRPLPPIASLNRTLPETVINDVTAGAAPDTANITITVRESENSQAVNGKTLSGAHDLRVFRNGQLVAQFPQPPLDTAVPTDLAGWASATRLFETGQGSKTITVPVRLKHGENYAEFTAYAFNNERVKGETTGFSHAGDSPAVTPNLPVRRPRAVVLTFGVDTNGNTSWERWQLNYAANDARSMAKALSIIPGYSVETLALTSSGTADNRATKAIMRAVLLTLSGNAGPAEQAILRNAGIPATSMTPLRPDDMLLISWSGHGVTLDNQFYLVPADTLADDKGAPRPDTMISAADLSRWLGAVDAGDMALIIDACHSAASVDDGRFKPGPMGDASLGQLAFDKGIRILAATQADNVALEDGAIGHGLLTYALVRDGLARKSDGMLNADVNSNGTVTLNEWLAYPVDRLPVLAAEIKAGTLKLQASARMIGNINAPARAAQKAKIQQPALFNFTDPDSPIIVRSKAAPSPDSSP